MGFLHIGSAFFFFSILGEKFYNTGHIAQSHLNRLFIDARCRMRTRHGLGLRGIGAGGERATCREGSNTGTSTTILA